MGYARQMSRQLAFRLSEEEIGILDELVRQGLAADRTAALRRALAAEARRMAAEHDARIYAQTEPDEEMTALASWATAQARTRRD